MESLVANYASSDEETDGRGGKEAKPPSPPPSKPFSSSFPPPRPTSSTFLSSVPPSKSSRPSSSSPAAAASPSSLFSSLSPPKTSSSSSLLSSLPPPRSNAPSSLSSSSSSLFSSLPPPNVQQPKPPPFAEPSAKRVVQFSPPINPSLFKPDDVDGDDDEDNSKGKKRTKDFSSKPFASIVPPPKKTLGLAPSARRSIIEADVPAASTEAPRVEEVSAGVFADQRSYGGQSAGVYAQDGVDGQLDSGAVSGDAAPVASSWAPTAASYEAYDGYGSYEGYDNNASYGGYWDYGASAAGATSATDMPESARTAVKRGRDEIPSEILEVKQEELMKNRPREDQVRLTGIAFGPAYQPPSSGKGKPSKLHRRKHQIGSLYFDMRQKEMELAERRAKGLLTKKETQGKYGW